MYKQREIVLVPFFYSDLSSSKRRPVLIISSNRYNEKFPDIVVCVITSNLYKDEFSVILNDADLEAGILPENSVINAINYLQSKNLRYLKDLALSAKRNLKK